MHLPIWISRYHLRRGVTLVEMLVTLAILMVMMTAIVQIFQAATTTLSASRAYQEIDNGLRRVDAMIRSDFNGVTAKMTPPNNPKDNRGYFEYGENAFADLQGEDCDDYVRFTVKAPVDRPFTGRFWPNGFPVVNSGPPVSYNNPITITSQYAEVIYFVRNGNLYRRVFLIAPEHQKSAWQMSPTDAKFQPQILNGTSVSWQGMNDISARPSTTGVGIVLNTLGDLTNRENRAFSPRFTNDFDAVSYSGGGDPTTYTPGYDQTPDDLNSYTANTQTYYSGNGVPDYYPTLYPNVFKANVNLVFETSATAIRGTGGADYKVMAFPYVFPGAYSRPDPYTSSTGWLHSPNPDNATPANYLDYLRRLNHNPLEIGDNLPRPAKSTNPANLFLGEQTWWGFPTWRETLFSRWSDPTYAINVNHHQPAGLTPRNSVNGNDIAISPSFANPNLDTDFLPPINLPFSDGVGSASNFLPPNPDPSWEDDLVLTGVRSFDIKILDNSLGDYVDLGWGDDARHPVASAYYVENGNAPPYLGGNRPMVYDPTAKAYKFLDYQVKPTASMLPIFASNTSTIPLWLNNQWVDLINATFAHEGRIPPLVTDNRLDAQFPNASYVNGNATVEYGGTYNSNIGDGNSDTVRLRRVWDSWSTDYSVAPARGVNPQTKQPIGPPFSPPVYPSYPPPYPAAMRGLQIQIRAQDPTGKYVKSLTIRQDFTEKL